MKTYRSRQYGFEIDIPEEWLIPMEEPIRTPFGRGIAFACGPDENCNIECGQSIPESLDQTEKEFRRYALRRQYTGLEVGRIAVGGKDHVWARYQMGTRDWAKKYLIVFGETEYAITTSCSERARFVEREPIWDTMVISFRLTKPTEPVNTTGIVERAKRAQLSYERGQRHFLSGRYQKALEQFELGKTVTHEFPWNFLGASITIMQMLEAGVIPEDKIELALVRAEKNLEMCLLMSPGDPVYLDAKRGIEDFKKRHNL